MEVNSAMAELDINEEKIDEDKVNPVEEKTLRRSSRKKIKDSDKRRVTTKPRKLNESKSIENYYLDKKVKITQLSLETIFEEPQNVKGKFLYVSPRKLRRLLNFNNSPSLTKLKVKKRQMKSKKISLKKKKRLPMKLLLDKLAILETED